MWFETIYNDDACDEYDWEFERADFQRRLKRERPFEECSLEEHYSSCNKLNTIEQPCVNLVLKVCTGCHISLNIFFKKF